MKKVLVLFAVALMFASVAYSQVHFEFHCTGSGNMVKDSPVIYAGAIDGGDLAPGTWTITVDDLGWDPVGNDALRWDYLLGCDPTRILFLDIETLGLTSTPVFLVGTIHPADDGRMHMRQIFARDYAEERHILEHFARRVGDFDVIVTYNGKTFDWPYLRDRSNYHAVQLLHEPEHMDLLHEARRRWRHVLPNCKLQTLEYHVCRRRRTGDIPGDMIAEAYHHYVKTGDARRMETVIHHNALDLVTMVELMLFMLQGGDLVWE